MRPHSRHTGCDVGGASYCRTLRDVGSWQDGLSMPKFKVVILPHGYPSVEIEREVVCGAGGELVDGDTFPDEAAALHAAEEADAISSAGRE